MSKAFSLYLDMVRFSAAILVFLWHSRGVYAYDNLAFKLGHEAVVIFFVLSGLVIAFCHETKERHLSDYIVNRASRIYSVAFPALVITVVLDLASNAMSSEVVGTVYDLPLLRFVTSMLFLNEMWAVSIQSFSNTPYWSINYEVWYYVSFAIVFYVSRWRLPLLLIVSLFVGPKILVLAPCWWLGVWIYRSNPLRGVGRSGQLGLLLFSFVAFWLFISNGVSSWGWSTLESLVGSELFKEIAFSRHFITDYLLAAIIALNFSAGRALFANIDYQENLLTKGIRFFADTTFALYLLHQPLLHFFDELLAAWGLTPQLHYLVVCICGFAVIVVIGHKLEETKYAYRNLFRWLLFNYANKYATSERLAANKIDGRS